MIVRLLVALFFWLPPRPAAIVAAVLRGDLSLVEPLLRICKRESRCQRIGVHKRDAHLDGWAGQVRLGHLDAQCQPHEPGQWTTRGAWGLGAASHWAYLPRCYRPSILDVPIVSAWVASAKLPKLCGGAEPARWCPSIY